MTLREFLRKGNLGFCECKLTIEDAEKMLKSVIAMKQNMNMCLRSILMSILIHPIT